MRNHKKMIENFWVKDVSVEPVPDGKYYEVIIPIIRSCQDRCFCSIFIIDYDLDNDEQLRVDNILFELACAHWRGVETRLIIGGSRTNGSILDSALLAQARAKELNINVRLAAASQDNNSHVKLVIADDMVLSGSHNWSRSMFGGQIQDSIIAKSSTLSAWVSRYFENQWLNTPTEEYDVSI